ncbi:MAG: PKD domain-containing protein [Bacteroidota bacterium]
MTLNFNDLSLPRGGSYTWIMGNGDTLYGPNPGPITYQQGTDDTTYYIRLIIQNSCSTVEKIDSVVVFPQPQVVVGTDFSEGCSPLLISFANLTVGNPDNFSWDLGQGGALVTDSIPAPRYYVTDSLDSVYTIYLTATNSCGSDIDSVDILVHPNNLDPIFNTSNTQGCMPFTVQFTNLSGASIVSWDYGDNSGNADVGIMAPNHTFTDSGTYLVRMFVDNGCSKDTGEVLITVHPQEPAVFVASDPVCLGDTLSFQPTGGGNVNGYLWHFGDGDSSTATLAQHVYQAPGTYQVSLTSFSQSFQCPNQWDTVVTVYALPPASLNLDTTAGCQPLSLQLSNGPTGLTYWYDFGNGDTSTVLNPAYTYADSGDFVLQLTTQDGNGCRADTAVNIRVHPLPMSDFVPDQDSLCGPGPVAFTQGSTLATRYHWDFGTGNAADTSALLNPIFPYQNPGSYQVSLTNTTVFGCQDSVEKRVVVLPASQAALQADTVQGCQPLTVSFSHQASGFGRLRWDFGDGSAGFVGPSPPPHTFFGGDTTYTVRLLADTAGLCLDSASLEIRLATPPRAAFLPDDHQACGSDTVLFTNQSTSAVLPLSYVWDFGAPGQSFQANPPAVVFPQADIYPVSLIATNSFGCADTAAEVVRIHPEPEADFALSDSLICPSTLIQFTNLSSNYSGARWEFGDGAFSFADSPDHVYGLQDTEVMVSLVVDTAGFCFDSVEKRLQIASFPVADFSFSPDSFCGAADVNFVNLSTTLARPISYQWTFGNGLSSNVADPQTAYTVDDTLIQFPVRLITTNTFGCADTANQWVTGFPQPLAAFQPLPDSGCSELVVNFVNLSENYTHSLWNFGNGLFSDDAFPTTIYPTGVFDVELVVSYENVCFDRLRVEDQIVVKQSAIAAFTFDNASFQPRDGTVIFSNQSQFADRFRWFFGDGVSSPEINPTHRYMVNDTFMVSLIANNAWNCPDTAILPVRPWPFGDVQIPNAFKPGSGLDSTDVFLPVAVGLVEWEIGVYDIYGNRVWHSTALGAVGSPLEGRPIESWDGTIHTNSRINSGGPVKTPDVFTWKIHKAVFKGGRRFEGRREGTVTVLR